MKGKDLHANFTLKSNDTVMGRSVLALAVSADNKFNLFRILRGIHHGIQIWFHGPGD